MPDDPLERLRAICLALPEAIEKEAWGDPTFRVRDKIFAMPKVGDGRVSLWCKAPTGMQEMLVDAAPERFFVPPWSYPGLVDSERLRDTVEDCPSPFVCCG